jgi:hypothetical protein
VMPHPPGHSPCRQTKVSPWAQGGGVHTAWGVGVPLLVQTEILMRTWSEAARAVRCGHDVPRELLGARGLLRRNFDDFEDQ